MNIIQTVEDRKCKSLKKINIFFFLKIRKDFLVRP